MLISGDTLFCISQKDDFNLHWHDIIDTQNHSSVQRPNIVNTPPSQCVNSSNSHQMKGNLHSAYCGIQITTKPYTEQSFDSASLSKNILSKPRPPQQSKIAQSMCKRFSFMVRQFYSIRPVSFHIIQKNVNLATSLYFGAESEFIIAAQTFSSLRIAKCGLELTITIH